MHPPYTIHLHKNHPFYSKFVFQHPWDVNTIGLILGQIHILCQVCPAVMRQKELSDLLLPKPHNLNKVKHHTAPDYRKQTDSTVTTRYRHRYQKIGCINGKVLEQTLQHSNYNTDSTPPLLPFVAENPHHDKIAVLIVVVICLFLNTFLLESNFLVELQRIGIQSHHSN